MFEKYLQEIGLSDKEATVYLALLQVENSSISDLAKKTKINRTTVYPVLQSLQKKGLASEAQVGKTIHYQAAPPERLETFVERQKVVLEERSARLKDIIPQIKSIAREEGERPVVKIFEGRDGAISAYQEFYDFPKGESKNGHFAINSDLLEEVFTEKEMERFRVLRTDKDIRTTVVYNRKAGARNFEKSDSTRHLDSTTFPITCDIGIIDDRVVISTLGDKISSILIKSKDVANTLSSLIKFITKQ